MKHNPYLTEAQGLMVQGTSSDAGKSTVAAGICRVLRRQGINVAPFKPQNMALNSAVTADGGEIGRAQALQALACGLEPHTDMNPVLIKPSSDTGAQIIIQGQVKQNMDARAFHAYKPTAMDAVMTSYHRLCEHYSMVVVEGAGSPAEINLRAGDIANMGFAEAADCPVVLVADIDRGGVFAQIVGTLDLLSTSEQNRVVGFIINKFRGDIKLLHSGLEWLEARTGKPVFGVLPYLQEFYIDAEDAIDDAQPLGKSAHTLKVVVPVLPRISNHTDFDVLRLHPNVELTYVRVDQSPPAADLIILPGSKNVRSDLARLRSCGWAHIINKHLRYGGKVIGICGGLQMLGQTIDDPEGLESRAGVSKGLGLIPLHTVMEKQKTLRQVEARLELLGESVPVKGYEIHQGCTPMPEAQSAIHVDGLPVDGYLSEDKQIFASYIHGLFDEPAACNLLLQWAGLADAEAGETSATFNIRAYREQQLDRLADSLNEHIDVPKLMASLSMTDAG